MKAAHFMREKMRKRKERQYMGAAGAGLSVAGGLAFGLGALGVAGAMMTPIGWGLAAAGGAVALGLGAHKLYRWAKKRRQKGSGKGLGEERTMHAQHIHAAMNLGEVQNGKRTFSTLDEKKTHIEAKRLLDARRIKHEHASGKAGVEYLKKKMERW